MHATYAHPELVSTLPSVRKRSHWSSITRQARGNVLLFRVYEKDTFEKPEGCHGFEWGYPAIESP